MRFVERACASICVGMEVGCRSLLALGMVSWGSNPMNFFS